MRGVLSSSAWGGHPSFADQTLVANFFPDLGTGEQWLLPTGDPRRQRMAIRRRS